MIRKAINNFSRLGYQALTTGIVNSLQWASLTPDDPVVITGYYLLSLTVDNQYYIIIQSPRFGAFQVNNCSLVK